MLCKTIILEAPIHLIRPDEEHSQIIFKEFLLEENRFFAIGKGVMVMKKIGVIFLIAALVFTSGCSLLFQKQGDAQGIDSLLEQFGKKRTWEQADEGIPLDGIDPYGFYKQEITSVKSIPSGFEESAETAGEIYTGNIPPTKELRDILTEAGVKSGTAFCCFYEGRSTKQGYAYELEGNLRFSAEEAFADILEERYGPSRYLEEREDISSAEFSEYLKASIYCFWMDGGTRIELIVYPPEEVTTFYLVFTDTKSLNEQIKSEQSIESSVPEPVSPPNPYNFKEGDLRDENLFITPEEILALPNAQKTELDGATQYSAPVTFLNRNGTLNVYAAESIFCTEYILEYTKENRNYTDNVLLLQALIREIKRYLGRDYDAVLKNYENQAQYTDMLSALNHEKTGDIYEMVWYVDEMADISVGVRAEEDGSGSIWVAYNSYF